MDQMTLATLTGRPETVANPRLNRVRALFEPLLAHQRILRQIIELKLNDWLSVPLLDLRDPQAVRDRALARHQRLPTRDALHAWDDELCRALSRAVYRQEATSHRRRRATTSSSMVAESERTQP